MTDKIVFYPEEVPYTWTQTLNSVEIFVPTSLRARDLKDANGEVKLLQFSAYAKEKSASAPLLDISLLNAIDTSEESASWEIKNNFLIVSLKKLESVPWPCLVHMPIGKDAVEKFSSATISCTPIPEATTIMQAYADEFATQFKQAKDAFFEQHKIEEPQPDAAKNKFEQATLLFQAMKFEEAMPLYEESAKLGNLQAKFALAQSFSEEDAAALQLVADNAKVLFYYEFAVFQHEDYRAAAELAMRYKLENNAAKSILFFTFLAIRGDSRSMETLGDIYYKGLGDVAPNPAKAMDWFKASFHRGSPSGAFFTGMLYKEGSGVPVDLERAIRCFDLASFWNNNNETYARVANDTRRALAASKAPDSSLPVIVDDDQLLDEVLDETMPSGFPMDEDEDEDDEEALLRNLEAERVQDPVASDIDAILKKASALRQASRPHKPSTPVVASNNDNSTMNIITPNAQEIETYGRQRDLTMNDDEDDEHMDEMLPPIEDEDSKSTLWSVAEYGVAASFLGTLAFLGIRYLK